MGERRREYGNNTRFCVIRTNLLIFLTLCFYWDSLFLRQREKMSRRGHLHEFCLRSKVVYFTSEPKLSCPIGFRFLPPVSVACSLQIFLSLILFSALCMSHCSVQKLEICTRCQECNAKIRLETRGPLQLRGFKGKSFQQNCTGDSETLRTREQICFYRNPFATRF